MAAGRAVGRERGSREPDPKALAGYGLLVRRWDRGPYHPPHEGAWLRFVDGRPISGITTQFLDWACATLAAAGKRALLRAWDTASWHHREEVRQWLTAHNRQVRPPGPGGRLVPCPLPIKRPWLNPIEPKWGHGKRQVVEPDRLLPARELAQRVCAAFDCASEPHLVIPNSVA